MCNKMIKKIGKSTSSLWEGVDKRMRCSLQMTFDNPYLKLFWNSTSQATKSPALQPSLAMLKWLSDELLPYHLLQCFPIKLHSRVSAKLMTKAIAQGSKQDKSEWNG